MIKKSSIILIIICLCVVNCYAAEEGEKAVKEIQDIGSIKGKIVHIDEETIGCLVDTGFSSNPVNFSFEIITVAVTNVSKNIFKSKLEILNILVPQPTDYKIGSTFEDDVIFVSGITLNDLVKTYSKCDCAIQSGCLRIDGIVKR